jgi:hypothetical protein
VNLGSFRILLPFFPNILVCWRPKFSNFLTVFTIGLSLAQFFGGPLEFRGGGFEHLKPPPPGEAPDLGRYGCVQNGQHLYSSDVPCMGFIGLYTAERVFFLFQIKQT